MYSRLPSRFFLRRGDVCTQLKLCRIRILNFLSYSFGIETTNTLIHNRSSLVNHTRFQRKMGKIFSRFQTKTAQKPATLWGGTYLYRLYKGVPPPGSGDGFAACSRALENSMKILVKHCSISFFGSLRHFSGRRIKVSIILKITHWKYKLTKKSWPVWELCTTIQYVLKTASYYGSWFWLKNLPSGRGPENSYRVYVQSW